MNRIQQMLYRVTIGKKYRVINRNYGIIVEGVLKFVEFGQFTDSFIEPKIWMQQSDGRLRCVYAGDAGIIPYHYGVWNDVNHTEEVK